MLVVNFVAVLSFGARAPSKIGFSKPFDKDGNKKKSELRLKVRKFEQVIFWVAVGISFVGVAQIKGAVFQGSGVAYRR